MKITASMYFFSAYNLLDERELSVLKQKYDHCAFFIAERSLLAFACATRENVAMIIKDLQSYDAYKDEELDPTAIQRY